MIFDYRYMILMGPTILFALIASVMVQSAFAKWKRVANASGMTGAEAAYAMLQRAGLREVRIERAHGILSDHYDPRHRVLRLSQDVHDGRSVASVGVALHEAGHALQHAQKYAPLTMRTALVPLISIGGGYLPVMLIFIGLMFRSMIGPLGMGMAMLGLLFFAGAVVFSLITLPVEFNASSRAKRAAIDMGIVAAGREAAGVSSVLNAAALTYVAAAATALMQLLYFALLVFGGRRN